MPEIKDSSKFDPVVEKVSGLLLDHCQYDEKLRSKVWQDTADIRAHVREDLEYVSDVEDNIIPAELLDDLVQETLSRVRGALDET